MKTLIFKSNTLEMLSKFKLKQLLLGFCMSTLLIACSVEKKPTEPSTDVDSTIITNPDDIVLPPTTEIITSPSIPEAKADFTNKQLFADTLGSHNRVRAKHGLSPLKWSQKLAAYSQQWADNLGSGNSCKMYHRSGTPPYGENLYTSSATVWSEGNKVVRRDKNRVTITNVVKAWADEEKWYNYKTNSCQPGKLCGHYTQIVWRDTTEVGCAVKYCGDNSQTWVCSYNPPGNFTGKRPY